MGYRSYECYNFCLTMEKRISLAESLIYFFYRPEEPGWFPKGNNDAVRFVYPIDYLSERSKTVVAELASRFGNVKENIEIKKIDLPDLSEPLRLGKRENFSTFIPLHMKMAGRVIEVLLGMRTLEDLRSAVAFCKENLNSYLFIYALSVAIIHRPDTRDLGIPPLSEIFPGKFFGDGLLPRARKEASVFDNDNTQIPLRLPLDYTGSDLEEEHRVAYFREDVGINLHHWHWHLAYPYEGAREVVNKNRRGELFYYMHQQIIARYNFERLCNKLGRVKRLQSLSEPLKEGYFPKLDTHYASKVWPARPSNTLLSDLDREEQNLKLDIQDLYNWKYRIFDAIHLGYLILDNGQQMPLTEEGGIDELGNLVEASILSRNPRFYGNIHNMGHLAIAYSHDPDNRHLEKNGVMGDSATAMRDPIFYRWHASIDDIFQEYKATLPPYPVSKLNYDGISITGLSVQTDNINKKNEFHTTYDSSNVNLSAGLDFVPRASVFAQITHLNHKPFTYTIKVKNTGAQRKGTVRIFIAPASDEQGVHLFFRSQRLQFCELDRFVVELKSGDQEIKRQSVQSSVTIPFEQTFRDLTTNRPAEGNRFSFCGCGWPQHMLIPKGTPEGFPCDLFVMISNYADDAVNQPGGGADGQQCDDGSSYCGIRNKLYPDKRAMGFPFDRPTKEEKHKLNDFMQNLPNMAVIDVNIVFTPPKKNPNIVE